MRLKTTNSGAKYFAALISALFISIFRVVLSSTRYFAAKRRRLYLICTDKTKWHKSATIHISNTIHTTWLSQEIFLMKMLLVYQDGTVSAKHWDRASKNIWGGGGGGGAYTRHICLISHVQFFASLYILLLNVIVEYISDTCIYVTARRIPGGPTKDYRRTRDLSSYTFTHTFMCPPKDLDGTTLLRFFHKPISLFYAVVFELTHSG